MLFQTASQTPTQASTKTVTKKQREQTKNNIEMSVVKKKHAIYLYICSVSVYQSCREQGNNHLQNKAGYKINLA